MKNSNLLIKKKKVSGVVKQTGTWTVGEIEAYKASVHLANIEETIT